MSAKKSAWQPPLAAVIEKIGTAFRSGLIDTDTATELVREAVTTLRPPIGKKETAARANELDAIYRIRAFTVSNDEQHEKLLRQVWREITSARLRQEVKELLEPSKRKKRSRDAEMHYYRWRAVFEARREGLKRKPRGTWGDAYKDARGRLDGSPYAGKARMMRESYELVQRIRRQAAKVGQQTPG